MSKGQLVLACALALLGTAPAFAAAPAGQDQSKLVFEFITLPSGALLLSGLVVYWLARHSFSAATGSARQR